MNSPLRPRRSAAQRAAWKKLPTHCRMMIAAEHPDDFEREEALRVGTWRALEGTFGPRQWDVTVAILAEGEATEVDFATPDVPDGLTYREIGDAIGLSPTRVQHIIEDVFSKLRKHPVLNELRGRAYGPFRCMDGIDVAIANAHEAVAARERATEKERADRERARLERELRKGCGHTWRRIPSGGFFCFRCNTHSWTGD